MKRIIAVMALLMFAAVLLYINSFSVYADDYLRPEDMTAEEYERVMTNKYEFEQQYLYYVSQYEHGYMTHSDFVSEVNNLTEEYVQRNTNSDGVLNSIAKNVSNTVTNVTNGISNAVGAVGEGVKDIIDDVLSPYATTESVSNADTLGYGSLCIYYNYADEPSMCNYIYCPWGTYEILENGSYRITVMEMYRKDYYYNGELSNTTEKTVSSYSFVGYDVQFYGDWRNPNDTTEQLPTNDEFTDVPTYDFSNATDSELEELLNELNETLKREMPDLSTMEGLLESIYYRLGTLDSDDDNALLSDINKAVMTLMQTNSSENAELVSVLLEIRDELINESNDTSNEDSDGTEEETENGHPDHICGTLYNVKPLDKNWLSKLFTDVTELKVEYQGEKYYLQSCGCLLLDDKYYSVDMNYDSYTQIDYDFNNEDVDFSDIVSLKDGVSLDDIDFGSAYDMDNFAVEQPVSTYSLSNSATTASIVNDRNFLSDILTGAQEDKIDFVVDLVDNMVALGVPYDSINNSIYMFESIIFDDYTPQDLTFNAFDTEVTILSYSWFTSSDGVWEDSDYKTGLDIVRLFTSILIGFAWSLSMRKKIVSML